MNQQRLFRIIVPAKDIGESADFYARLLDQTGFRISPGRHYFSCSGVTLAVYCPEADGDDRQPYANFDYVYFAVDDIESHFARAEALGCLFRQTGDGDLPMGEIETRPWGERSFYARDPIGNPICFVDSVTVFSGP